MVGSIGDRTPETKTPAPYSEKRVAAPNEMKRQFARAVDLYFAERYAEALALFSSLGWRLPGNPEIERSRALCIQALRKPLALPMKSSVPASKEAPRELSEHTVKDALVSMMYGASEPVRLRAAELAARILGMTVSSEAPSREEAEAVEALNAALRDEDARADGDDSAPVTFLWGDRNRQGTAD